jgi:YD repeat-containing protein
MTMRGITGLAGVVAALLLVSGGLARAQSAPTLLNGGGGQGWSNETEMRAAQASQAAETNAWGRLESQQADAESSIFDYGVLGSLADLKAIDIAHWRMYMEVEQRLMNGNITLASGIRNGAEFDLPFGHYSSNGLISGYQLGTRGPDIFLGLGDAGSDPTVNGGWLFEPRSELVQVAQVDPYSMVDCLVVVRFNYIGPNKSSFISFQAAGPESECSFPNGTSLNGFDAISTCPDQMPSTCLPDVLWSIDGQTQLDLSSQAPNAVIRFPDGSIEVLAPGQMLYDIPGSGFYAGELPINLQPRWNTAQRIDRNGNTTSYSYNTSTNTETVTDPLDRVTKYIYQSSTSNSLSILNGIPQVLQSIVQGGPGGAQLTWTLMWQETTPSLYSALPDFICYWQGAPTSCPMGDEVSFTINLLQKLTIPDGRSYSLQYGPWGALTQVTSPDGSVTAFTYGDQNSPTRSVLSDFGEINAGEEGVIRKRSLVSKTVYPSGLSGPAYVTSFEDDPASPQVILQMDNDGTITTYPGRCAQVWWDRVTAPDGSYVRTGRCFDGGNYLGPFVNTIHNKEVARESYSSTGSLLEATYQIDLTTGTPYFLWEAGIPPNTDPEDPNCPLCLYFLNPVLNGSYLDVRTSRWKHVKDGLTWWEELSYDTMSSTQGAIQCPGTGCYRTFGNINNRAIAADNEGSPGPILAQTAMAYQYGSYVSLLGAPFVDLIRLPTSLKTEDGSGNVITRTDHAHDQFALTASGGSNLTTTYIVNGLRGNPTTTTSYVTPSSGTGPVAAKMYYYDNGATQKVTDPNGNSTATTSQFGACSGNPKITTTVTNALGQTGSTVHDCYSGAVLSYKDANGQLACTQLDGLGRLVESAAPGDELTTQTQCTTTSSPTSCFVRDTANCASSGTVIGNNGAGPTSWTQYYPFGIGTTTYNRARTVVASRNGTPNGLQHVTFVDGLLRSIQQCAEVDPTLSVGPGDAGAAGVVAACSSTVYDNMGRAYQQYVPFYAGTATAMPATVTAYPSADQYTQTLYDSLGRVTSVQLMASGAGQLPATTTAYSISGTDWLTTVTDANNCQVQTWTDLLGHTVDHQVQNESSLASGKCSGSPTWLTTTMLYDVAGRLLTVTDPASNQTTFAYDGLGRKTSMVDPDMGTWAYQYDGNGNLTQQTDARGAVINMHYDALNRVYLKDLPYWNVSTGKWVAGTPGEEDEYNYYDSAGALTGVDQGLPSTCYSCDDHCSTTTDTCNTGTLTCSNTGSTTGCPNQ